MPSSVMINNTLFHTCMIVTHAKVVIHSFYNEKIGYCATDNCPGPFHLEKLPQIVQQVHAWTLSID